MADINEIGEIEEGLEVKSNEQGQCPVCNGEEVSYDSMEFEGNMAYFPCSCDKCGATWNEWYELDFVSHDQVYSGD